MAQMTSFVRDRIDFERSMERFRSMFLLKCRLPDQVFHPVPETFLFFEFDRLFAPEGWKTVRHLSKISEDQAVNLAVVEPDPDYFSGHFGYFGLLHLSVDLDWDAAAQVFESAPPDSPADALIYNTRVIALCSDTPNWGMWCERQLGIGVIGIQRHDGEALLATPGLLGFFTLEDALVDLVALNFAGQVTPPHIISRLRQNYGR